MNAESFESMVNRVIAYIDGHNITKSIRYLGFNVRHTTWIQKNKSSGSVYATLRIGLEGIPSSYMIVLEKFIKFEEFSIRTFELTDLYMKALRNLHKLAVNKRFGLNSYMPEPVSDAIMDAARVSGVSYNDLLNSYRRMGFLKGGICADEPAKNYIMEDTDMIYTLLNKPTRRSGARWLAALVPEKIHFNGPATIIEWNDGTKTVVKCQKGDTFDPMTGVAMACMKKMLGTNESGSNYLNDVSKLIDEALEARNKRYEKKEKALKQKKEAEDVSDPDWNTVAKELDKRFDKAIDMLLRSTDDMLNNCNPEDKHD